MQNFRDLRIVRIWITAIYALSMAVVGFAHVSVPSVANPNGFDAAAYTLPDGSIASICFNEGDGKSPQASNVICSACLLTASPGLLSCPAISVPVAQIVARVDLAPAEATVTPPFSGHVPHLRGPPSA